MKLPTDLARRQQAKVAITYFIILVAITAYSSCFPIPKWILFIMVAASGLGVIYALRRISNSAVCPTCQCVLMGIDEALSSQNRKLNFCPSCGGTLAVVEK